MRLTATAILLLSLASAAQAACFENLGSTGCPDQETFPKAHLWSLSCENLWYVRNSIYDEHGYCFRTKAGKEAFDNSDCYEDDASRLQFNKHEKANISRIVEVEKDRGCRKR